MLYDKTSSNATASSPSTFCVMLRKHAEKANLFERLGNLKDNFHFRIEDAEYHENTMRSGGLSTTFVHWTMTRSLHASASGRKICRLATDVERLEAGISARQGRARYCAYPDSARDVAVDCGILQL
jgi:hypothetical protein